MKGLPQLDPWSVQWAWVHLYWGSSTSKSIPLQSTGLAVKLIISTIKANPTITPGETNPCLVSEGHLPVLSVPAMVGLCP